VCMAGGYGSGKTLGGIHWAISRGFRNEGLSGIWIEPTYQLVKRVAIPGWTECLEEMGIPYKEHKADMAMTVGPRSQNFKVYFHSGQHPERLVGQTAAWAVLDEAALLEEKVFRNVLARVRHPKATLMQVCCVTTPEGFNWVYDRFVKEKRPDSLLIRAKTRDNPFLPKEYEETLKEQYSEQEFEQYCNGHFVAMSGAVYSRFTEEKHCATCKFPLDGEIIVGADFNIGKMVWAIGSYDGETLHFFDEQVTHNRNTEEAAEMLDDKLKSIFKMHGHPYNPRLVKIYCDASGNSRKTSAHRTDTAILRSFGFRVLHNAKNPAVRDRVNAVNLAFLRSSLYIEKEGCKNLFQSITQQGYDESGMPEKKGLDHGADAIGYAVSYLMPVIGRRSQIYKYT
jgi:PBSX family phage terminase large subunit